MPIVDLHDGKKVNLNPNFRSYWVDVEAPDGSVKTFKVDYNSVGQLISQYRVKGIAHSNDNPKDNLSDVAQKVQQSVPNQGEHKGIWERLFGGLGKNNDYGSCGNWIECASPSNFPYYE